MSEGEEECPFGDEHLQEPTDQGPEDSAGVKEAPNHEEDLGEREKEWNEYLNEKAQGGDGDGKYTSSNVNGFHFTDGILSKLISAFENTHDIVVSISEFVSSNFIGTKSEVVYYGVYLFLMAVVIIVYAIIAIALALGFFILELFRK